jgi:hypothetical protein
LSPFKELRKAYPNPYKENQIYVLVIEHGYTNRKNTITSEKVLEAVNDIGSKDDLTKIFVNSIQNIFDRLR